MNSIPNDKTPTVSAKGDNMGNATNSHDEQFLLPPPTPPHTAYSKSGRPLRKAASKQTYVDSEDSDSDMSEVVLKVDNRTSRSKPTLQDHQPQG